MSKVRTAILISGEGTNMQALIEAAKAPDFPAEITLVISNRPGARGLERAAKGGIKTLTIDHKAFHTRDEFDTALSAALKAEETELICMAGFMRLLGEAFVKEWHNRQLNIHPSLLPAFKGLHTHERVLKTGARFTGCTVHFVRHDMDSGPIIAQAAVEVAPNDTPETLSARVQKAEHQLYPAALAAVAGAKINIEGDSLSFTDTFRLQSPLFSPSIAGNETH